MIWTLFAVAGYCGKAVAAVIDKYLLNHRLPSPVLYAFYTGILSVGVVILIPFGVGPLFGGVLLLALGTGMVSLLSLWVFYEVVVRWEISRVATLVGGLSSFFTLLLAYFIGEEMLGAHEMLAFIVLVVAGALLTLEKTKKIKVRWDVLGLGACAAFLTALLFVLSKQVFVYAGFISGFFWIAMGSTSLAVLMFVVPSIRRIIKKSHSHTTSVSLWIVALNKAIGAAGFFLISIAVALGPTPLVNAFKAVEYGGVFILATLVSLVAPQLIKERLDNTVMIQKAAGIVLVGISIILLSL